MKIVADMNSQLRIRGKIHYLKQGDIVPDYDGDEVPNGFRLVGSRATKKSGIDFDLMSDEELRAYDPDLDALKGFMKKRYPEIEFAGNIGWPKLVERYLQGRSDRVQVVDNTGRTNPTISDIALEDGDETLQVLTEGGQEDTDSELEKLFSNEE